MRYYGMHILPGGCAKDLDLLKQIQDSIPYPKDPFTIPVVLRGDVYTSPIYIELPGVPPEDIMVELTENGKGQAHIVVSVNKRPPLRYPVAKNLENITAHYKYGSLTITFDTASPVSRSIPVTTT